MLTHDAFGRYPVWFNDTGGFWSSDDGIRWEGPAEAAYNTSVQWQPGGPANTTLAARQRPVLLFAADANGTPGLVGRPTHLLTGAGLPGVSHYDSFSFTFVQQVR